jgi:hypothetical protein
MNKNIFVPKYVLSNLQEVKPRDEPASSIQIDSHVSEET